MTIWDLFHLFRRFWLVVIAGVVATSGCAVLEAHQTGVYSGDVDVVLLAPPSSTHNVFAETTSSLVMLAGIVARISGGPGGAARSVSDNVTLVGEGLQHGFRIEQPNAGGQWEYRFDQPVLHIESAGLTLDEAQAQMGAALSTVRRTLDTLEARARVGTSSLVSLQMTPAQPVYTLLHGSRSRTLAAIGLVGVLLTMGTVLAANQFGRRRVNHRPAPPSQR